MNRNEKISIEDKIAGPRREEREEKNDHPSWGVQ
jgi:hypothetical protein